jgi:hypothetical protein
MANWRIGFAVLLLKDIFFACALASAAINVNPTNSRYWRIMRIKKLVMKVYNFKLIFRLGLAFYCTVLADVFILTMLLFSF